MPKKPDRFSQPIVDLRGAVLGKLIASARSRRLVRYLMVLTGAILFIFGVVPIIALSSTSKALLVAGGLAALGVWYLSGQPVRPPSTGEVLDSRGSAGASNLVSQLKRLKELHDSGALTDDEFERAKSRILS